MRKIALGVGIALSFSVIGFAEPYHVKMGDTLSQVVKDYFPSRRLYGKKGFLKDVLKLNPGIQNADHILPEQVIELPEFETSPGASEAVPTTSKMEVLPNEDRLGAFQVPGPWKLSLLYGISYLSLSQDGVLGTADLGVIFLNQFKLGAEYVRSDWTAAIEFSTYEFKYKAENSEGQKQMLGADGSVTYRNFSLGVGTEQHPLFANAGGRVALAAIRSFYGSMGWQKKWALTTEKPTWFDLKASVRYPFASASDQPDLQLSSFSAPSVHALAEYEHELFSTKAYTLGLLCQAEFMLERYSADFSWDAARGSSSTNVLGASGSIGLSLRF